MGRGRSGKGGSSTSVIDTDGSTIDLRGSPLKYGSNDHAFDVLGGVTRQQVEEQELKRLSAKVEYAQLWDGTYPSREYRGGKSSCSIPDSALKSATTMTHNHPRETGVLGGTFSDADMKLFADATRLKTMRASAKEGTYSITKTPYFDAKGAKAYIRDGRRNIHSAYQSQMLSLGNDYTAGRIDYPEYSKMANAAFNRYLVGVHDHMLAGQQKYGYTYTLERRK